MVDAPNSTAKAESSASEVDKSNARVQKMFGEIAGKYDRLNHLLSMQTDRFWRWRTVKKVPPVGERPILDICTGTGDLAFAFEKACRKQGLNTPIVAADFCPEMLEIGKEKAAKQNTPSVSFVEADAQKLPFSDDTFQIVSVAFGLRNVSDTDQGIREMARVCDFGGHVAVLEFSMPTWQPMKAAYGFYFRNILPKIGQMLARNNSAAYEYLPTSVGEFPQGEKLCDKLRAAGLVNVRFHPMTGGVATLYIGEKPAAASKKEVE